MPGVTARTPGTLFHRLYLAVIAIKGFDGVIETIAGLVLAFAGSNRLYDLVLRATAHHLEGHPDSVWVEVVRYWFYNLTQKSTFFIVFYLLVHGILKSAIVINLLLAGRWIFPIAAAVLAGFVAYMGYHLTLRWSWWLLAFALFDMMTLALVLNEWRNRILYGPGPQIKLWK